MARYSTKKLSQGSTLNDRQLFNQLKHYFGDLKRSFAHQSHTLHTNQFQKEIENSTEQTKSIQYDQKLLALTSAALRQKLEQNKDETSTFKSNLTSHANSVLKHVHSLCQNVNDSLETQREFIQNCEKSRNSRDLLSRLIENISVMKDTLEHLESSQSIVKQNALLKAESIGQVARDFESCQSEILATSQLIDSLTSKAKEVSSILNLIDDITEQTNLLALNASIEAARAGEQGKGFAVVAEEVRKLASRSTAATRTITDLLLNVESEATRASEALLNTVQSVNSTKNLIESLEQKSEEQRTQIESVEQVQYQLLQTHHLLLKDSDDLSKDAQKMKQNFSNAMQTLATSSAEFAVQKKKLTYATEIEASKIIKSAQKLSDAAAEIFLFAVQREQEQLAGNIKIQEHKQSLDQARGALVKAMIERSSMDLSSLKPTTPRGGF